MCRPQGQVDGVAAEQGLADEAARSTERLHGAGRHVVSDLRNGGANAHVKQHHQLGAIRQQCDGGQKARATVALLPNGVVGAAAIGQQQMPGGGLSRTRSGVGAGVIGATQGDGSGCLGIQGLQGNGVGAARAQHRPGLQRGRHRERHHRAR